MYVSLFLSLPNLSTDSQVGTNGIISFGRPFYFWYPQNFPTRYPWVRDTFVAAPFWQDVDIRSKGDIIYTTLYPGDSPEVFNTVNMFLVRDPVVARR